MRKLLDRFRALSSIKKSTPSFDFTIDTSKVSSTNKTFSLPLNTTIPDTMIVEWGDGSSGTFANTLSVSHIYPSAGVYQIKIKHSQNLNKMPYIKFQNKKEIISIDSPMFACYNGTSQVADFSSCFYGLDWLTTIPSKLFDNNINVINFGALFYNCYVLNNIPNELFDKNINCTTFNNCFYGCRGLKTIPELIFKNNINVTNFRRCFEGCVSLQLNSNIFCNQAIDITTRFSNITPDFSYCFYISSSFTGTKGTAPQLWNYTYLNTPGSTSCFASSYISNQITNSASVPTAWKG